MRVGQAWIDGCTTGPYELLGSVLRISILDQWMLTLLQEGKITAEAAMKSVSNKHDFELAMQQAGMAIPA